MSEAKAIAEGDRKALLEAMEKAGQPIEVGQTDGDGNLVTEERLEELHQTIDEAGLQALRTKYTIIENEGAEF